MLPPTRQLPQSEFPFPSYAKNNFMLIFHITYCKKFVVLNTRLKTIQGSLTQLV